MDLVPQIEGSPLKWSLTSTRLTVITFRTISLVSHTVHEAGLQIESVVVFDRSIRSL
ncbi:hypothetical protein SynA1560_01553 [Synechococcus sp. A15-60]|nr:hypothetical protein SynA1560_01553 [Synechococcus sp. A15-60]